MNKDEKLLARMWAATVESLSVIFNEYSELLKPRLVDRHFTTDPWSEPFDTMGLRLRQTEELRDTIFSLTPVKNAIEYLDRYYSDRLLLNATLRGYAEPTEHNGAKDYLNFLHQLLGMIERQPEDGRIRKRTFNRAIQWQYLSPIKRYYIRPFYRLQLGNESFRIAPGLSLRKPNRLDRYVLYCSKWDNSPHCEALLALEEPLSTEFRQGGIDELDAMELCMHLYTGGDYCSYTTLQYASGGHLPWSQSGSISHHAILPHYSNYILHTDELRNVSTQYQIVKQFIDRSSFRISWTRFNESYRRGPIGAILTDIDRFIDLSIAYEGLFGDRNDTSALNHKLAERAALTLTDKNLKTKKDHYFRLKKTYSVRSALVHGSKFTDAQLKEHIYTLQGALKS